jgi:hypothetical protein
VPLASPISWRPDPELRLKLERVRATFPTQRWSEVFNWLFDDPEIRDRLRERAEN